MVRSVEASETAAANRYDVIGSGLGQAIRNMLGSKRMALRS
jgi:hypothetical protein